MNRHQGIMEGTATRAVSSFTAEASDPVGLTTLVPGSTSATLEQP